MSHAHSAHSSSPDQSGASASPAGPEVRIEWLLAAPRELVFALWTDPVRLPRWYAPTGCRIEFRHLDIRPGGTFHSCIVIPGGHECWCVGEYLEITPPSRIVYTLVNADEHGTPAADPQHVGKDADWPSQTRVTVTFEEVDSGKRTRLVLCQTVLESIARRTGAYPSWLQMLDRMEEILGAS